MKGSRSRSLGRKRLHRGRAKECRGHGLQARDLLVVSAPIGDRDRTEQSAKVFAAKRIVLTIEVALRLSCGVGGASAQPGSRSRAQFSVNVQRCVTERDERAFVWPAGPDWWRTDDCLGAPGIRRGKTNNRRYLGCNALQVASTLQSAEPSALPFFSVVRPVELVGQAVEPRAAACLPCTFRSS
jgi:hypothetical protein